MNGKEVMPTSKGEESMSNVPEVKENQEMTALVEQHIAKYRVPVARGRKCVDGRHTSDQLAGGLARAGADLGYAMGLLAMGYSPQESFDLVKSFVENELGDKFCWHGDDHAENGCGHNNAFNTKIEAYNDDHFHVDAPQAEELFNLVKQAGKTEELDYTVLAGGHLEEAVIIVTGTTHTVLPFDEDENRQFFIYDQTRDKVFMKQLVEFVNMQRSEEDVILEVNEADYLTVMGNHTMTTLGLLDSSAGKPIYEVNVDQEPYPVKFVGMCPDLRADYQ